MQQPRAISHEPALNHPEKRYISRHIRPISRLPGGHSSRLCRTALGVLLATLSGCSSTLTMAGEPLPIRTRAIAVQGYGYGFPLLLMEQTREAATTAPYPCGLGAPTNRFKHLFAPPGPDFRAVVRPNVDTLYSSAFLDLSEKPMVLEVPAINDRFYMLAMLDAWSNNFAAPGTQQNGGKATRYLITGPGWTGTVPAGMERIAAPTSLVWIIGRTELKGRGDVPAANAVQKSYRLHPLGGAPVPAPKGECRSMASYGETPEDTVKHLDGTTFFDKLDGLLAAYPPPARDEKMLAKLRLIGVDGDPETSVAALSPRNREALDAGIARGQQIIDKSFDLAGRLDTWSPDPTQVPLGDYGDKYLVRAVVSQIGFGANRNEFAVYQNTARDGSKAMLDGSKASYRMQFGPGKTPPVNAFWSVTVYDADGFLVANPRNVYALGTNTGLKADPDGGATIAFSAQKPDDVPEQNWLPVPKGPFEVTLRMYWPEEPILSGQWTAPPIEKH